MNFHFILLAGGSGLRAGGELPKQFQLRNGRSMFSWSLQTYLSWPQSAGVVIVSHRDHLERCQQTLNELVDSQKRRSFPVQVVVGGNTRQESSLAGIKATQLFCQADDILFIHDAARPFLEEEELTAMARVFTAEPECQVASLVAPVSETIVRGSGLPGELMECLPRSELFAVKTPQGVRVSALSALLAAEPVAEHTDLLNWGAVAGLAARLIPAASSNRKVTLPGEW